MQGKVFHQFLRISLLNQNPSMVVQNLETWYMVTCNSAGFISHISLTNVWKRKVKSNKSVRWLDEPSQVKQASSAEQRLLGFLLEWATLATCPCHELWNETQAGQDNGKVPLFSACLSGKRASVLINCCCYRSRRIQSLLPFLLLWF